MKFTPRAIQTEYYGDNVRWFIATVIDARPQPGQDLEGRVKVRIHGTMSPSTKDIAEDDLPWAQVMIPTTEGGTSGLGATPRLEAGTLVFGFFMDGKASQIPMVLGSIPKFEYPTPVQLGSDPLRPEGNGIDKDGTDNENTGEVDGRTRENRVTETIKFFLSKGYSLAEAEAIAATINVASGMLTGARGEEFGVGAWSGSELEQLKNFSNDYQNFDQQIEFVDHQLNTTKKDSAQRIRNATTISQNDLSDNNIAVVASQELLGEGFEERVVEESNRINDRLGGGG